MINTLDEFAAFLKICRKQGVNDVKFGGVSVTFGEAPRKARVDDADAEIPTDELSPEELMYFHLSKPNENNQA